MDDSTNLHQQAIQAALSANWEQAVTLNQQILDVEPNNIDALNRAGRAYFELGNYSESKKHYHKALKCDPYNQIASKFLKRIEAFDKKGATTPRKASGAYLMNADLFIEEPGKTKLVQLLKVAEPQKLSVLSPGTQVQLNPKARGITVTDEDGEYLGVVPDDLSHQLLKLIHGGNKYQAFIKTIKTNGLSVLIREMHRSARFKNQPSFLDNLNAVTYSSDHITLMDDGDVIEDDGEDDDAIA
jgi:tetratricopeptide (TPR) repeat protein